MSSLHHVIREPKQAIENPPVLFMLHGYGSHELDLFSFADLLPDALKIYSLRAPHALFQSMGYAWFPLKFDSNGSVSAESKEGVLDAVKQVSNFINEVLNQGQVDKTNVSLLGFSQGCILSYLIAVLESPIIKNIVGLSGYFKSDFLEGINLPDLSHLNIFSSHGVQDEVINIEVARKSKQDLDALGIRNEYKEYQAGHTICEENFQDLLQFLNSSVKA